MTKRNRENLYEMLSKKRNPRLKSIATILEKLGIELSFKVKKKSAKAARWGSAR
jgi:DNA-binding phage protein